MSIDGVAGKRIISARFSHISPPHRLDEDSGQRPGRSSGLDVCGRRLVVPQRTGMVGWGMFVVGRSNGRGCEIRDHKTGFIAQKNYQPRSFMIHMNSTNRNNTELLACQDAVYVFVHTVDWPPHKGDCDSGRRAQSLSNVAHVTPYGIPKLTRTATTCPDTGTRNTMSGWDGGVVPVAVGSWVGLFGPWGGSSRPYHTPWSCGRSWSTQIVGCGHTGTDSPAWFGLVWSGLVVRLSRFNVQTAPEGGFEQWISRHAVG